MVSRELARVQIQVVCISRSETRVRLEFFIVIVACLRSILRHWHQRIVAWLSWVLGLCFLLLEKLTFFHLHLEHGHVCLLWRGVTLGSDLRLRSYFVSYA